MLLVDFQYNNCNGTIIEELEMSKEKFEKFTVAELNSMQKEWEDHLVNGKPVSDIVKEYAEFNQKTLDGFLHKVQFGK